MQSASQGPPSCSSLFFAHPDYGNLIIPVGGEPMQITFDDEPVKIQISQLSTADFIKLSCVEQSKEVKIPLQPAKVGGREDQELSDSINVGGHEDQEPSDSIDVGPPGIFLEQTLPIDTSCEGFVQWPGMWSQPYEAFDPAYTAGWLAAHCDGFMGCWQEFNEQMWEMPEQLPPSFHLPPTPPPPLPPQKGGLLEDLDESTEAEEMTSEATSDDESFSESSPDHASLEGKQAASELLAIVNSQDHSEAEDDIDADSVDVMRPITPPPGLGLCRPITPPPGLCATGSITPPPGLCHPDLITSPPGLCDTAFSDGVSDAIPNATPDWDAICSAIADGIQQSDIEERMSSSLSSDTLTFDEADEQTPILEHKYDAHISPLQPIRCRKLNKLRQQRTPGCAKAKKAHLKPESCIEVPVEATSPSEVMAVDDSKNMEKQTSLGASYTSRWFGMLAACLLVIGIAVLVICGMSRDDTVAKESSNSIVVTAGSSHAWATAAPRAASMANKLVAPLAKTMDIEVARGQAIASHVMTNVKRI